MTFSAIFSVRNVLRASGVVLVLCGGPMLAAPAFAASTYFSKRETPPPKEDEALKMFTRSFGTAVVGRGLHCLLAAPSCPSLAAALATEVTYFCSSVSNLLRDKCDKAGVDLRKFGCVLALNTLLIIAQVTALCCGDKSDSEETDKKD